MVLGIVKQPLKKNLLYRYDDHILVVVQNIGSGGLFYPNARKDIQICSFCEFFSG